MSPKEGRKQYMDKKSVTSLYDVDNFNQKNMGNIAKEKKLFLNKFVETDNRNYNMNKIKELADNILENGLLQPIVVYEIEGNKYEILSGYRRFNALKFLVEQGYEEFEEIKTWVITNKYNEEEKYRIKIASNAQREYTHEEIENGCVAKFKIKLK